MKIASQHDVLDGFKSVNRERITIIPRLNGNYDFNLVNLHSKYNANIHVF